MLVVPMSIASPSNGPFPGGRRPITSPNRTIATVCLLCARSAAGILRKTSKSILEQVPGHFSLRAFMRRWSSATGCSRVGAATVTGYSRTAGSGCTHTSSLDLFSA